MLTFLPFAQPFWSGHSFLRVGVPLVEGRDLIVEDDQVVGVVGSKTVAKALPGLATVSRSPDGVYFDRYPDCIRVRRVELDRCDARRVDELAFRRVVQWRFDP